MADSTTFRFFPDAEIQAQIDIYKDGIRAVNETGQSYSANGVSFTRGNLDSQTAYLGLLYAEQAKRTGAAFNRASPIIRQYGRGHGPIGPYG